MTDREKVISGLEHCSEDGCKDCPYHYDCTIADGFSELAKDVLELLKEQEPVKPIDNGDDSYVCDNCGETVGWEELDVFGIDPVKYKYCPGCGRRVKWNG